ncbi:hypothetical protein [Peribacillus frigoritolerans]|uniref:hypothetical protein n=1 Tax=Peribacillus castrilensis TaxID=2897690 RepID=UPI003DA618F9
MTVKTQLEVDKEILNDREAILAQQKVNLFMYQLEVIQQNIGQCSLTVKSLS